MKINEVVLDFAPAKERRDRHDALKKRSRERLAKMNKRRQDRKDFKDPDEMGAKRRSKLSQADQFRDITRQLRNKD